MGSKKLVKKLNTGGTQMSSVESYKSGIKIKKENKGKAQFPFQKVVMPVGFLAFFSVIFYFLTK